MKQVLGALGHQAHTVTDPSSRSSPCLYSNRCIPARNSDARLDFQGPRLKTSAQHNQQWDDEARNPVPFSVEAAAAVSTASSLCHNAHLPHFHLGDLNYCRIMARVGLTLHHTCSFGTPLPDRESLLKEL
jgi:hypothetical protein